MEILWQKNLEKAINYLEETKDSLAKVLDSKGKIIQIPTENIYFIKTAFNLDDDNLKNILKIVFNLKKQDIIIKYKNFFNIIKYDSDKLNSRFAWFWDEKDVENLIHIFKTTYDIDHIFNSVNSKITFTGRSANLLGNKKKDKIHSSSYKTNKNVERFLNNEYRKVLFEEYYANIKNKLSEFIKDPNALDRISKTIAWKILRDNFDKHLENIAYKFFNEISKIIYQNTDKLLITTNKKILKELDLNTPETLTQIKTSLQKIRIKKILENLNKIIFMPYYGITITDEQFLKALFKVIKKDPILKEKINSSRKDFKNELTLSIINKIQENKNNPSVLKHFEDLLSFFSWKEIRKWNKKFIFPKISLSFLEEEISNYKNPGKILVNQIINLTESETEAKQSKLKELIRKLSSLLWKLPKVEKLN